MPFVEELIGVRGSLFVSEKFCLQLSEEEILEHLKDYRKFSDYIHNEFSRIQRESVPDQRHCFDHA